jgi:putative DNA primase/helicase
MDAKEENPENRVFKGNPFRRVLDNRGRYIWAALTIVLAYRVAGSPGRLPPFGDPFEEWSDSVRSALCRLGYPDPVDTMREAKEHDPVRQARRAMFQAIYNAYGSVPRCAADMIDDAKHDSIKELGKSRPHLLHRKFDSGTARDLKAAIMQYTTDRLDSKYLGNKLNADRNRIVDGLILRSNYDSHRKVNSWYVEPQQKDGGL